jgi:hypothetical protein
LEALSNPEEAQRRTARGAVAVRHLLDLEKTGHELAAIYDKILELVGQTLNAPLRKAGSIESVPEITVR